MEAQSPQSNYNIATGSTLYTNSSANFWPSPSGHFAFGFYTSGNGFKFSVDGSRVLLRNSNDEVQSINEPTQSRAVAASMLDSGNFVLYDSSSRIVWASFDRPTDTLLVGQKLATDSGLYSSVSLTNQSIGNFKLWMQSDGNLNAFPLRSIQEGKYGYWSSYTSGAEHNATLNLDQDGTLYLGNSTGLSSKILWVAIVEEDHCAVKGTCGLNSYCSLNGTGIDCFCPPGFIYIDPEKPQEGCKLNSTIEDCLEDKSGNNYTISLLENTYWERDEYDIVTRTSEEACSRACLEDCGDGVINKTTKKIGREFLVVGIVLMALSLIIFMSTLYLAYAYQIWSNKIISRQVSSPNVVEEINLRSFSYEQLVLATKNFEEEIGRGGSGRVYKGSINSGKEVAVKKLIKMVEEGESEFRNEMKIIGRTHHKNLVQLVGFCTEGSNGLLVYEFMKNGSLANLLFTSEQRPSWNERRRIALEIAKGIHYLHDECETRIIHCDIKPQNILMDESWTAKISDFGLSKLLKPDQTRTYTILRGTRGYRAPEWHSNNSPITVKSDVYSFGVMLLEIVCCRKNMDETLRDEEVVLIDWAYHCYEAGEVQNLVIEADHVDMEELEKMVKIGLWCVETEFSLRPTMKQVILMMEGFVATPPPPSPYSSIRG
ncbi:non-specific serine/threonine protein kinase [Citrus sinensis]|uniref:Non-specific serine/threonine protein kinase n=1 Tax=Citrus sinensis TaxID=2711 RepID=A0ACB8JJD6_CITSI|nr:non-specific serine/threonine protein kinase [Citrus sinensis]